MMNVEPKICVEKKEETIESLRSFCNKVHEQRREDVKKALTDWLEEFILKNRRWRAVIGNKKCKPISIHRNFYSNKKSRKPYIKPPVNMYSPTRYYWPDLSDAEIKEIIRSLGFVVSGGPGEFWAMAVSVPKPEKGKSLTFAQEWVKKINHNYSLYCAKEKENAKKYFKEIISDLCNMPIEQVKTESDRVLFEGYQFKTPVSSKCHNYIRAEMAKNGIKEYYVDENNFGIQVFYDFVAK